MNPASSIRQAAVAGSFYPGEPGELQLMINKMLAAATGVVDEATCNLIGIRPEDVDACVAFAESSGVSA